MITTKNSKINWVNCLFCLLLASSLFLTSCSSVDNVDNTANEDSSSSVPEQVPEIAAKTSTDLPRLEGNATVEMVINGSPVIIEVKGEDAPITAGNFIDLVDKGFYNGLIFHRVVKNPQPFVAQGGDPQGTGTGGYVDPTTKRPRNIPLEIKLEGEEKPTYSQGLGRQAGVSAPSVVLKHTRGAVAMARSQAPDSASSQFYFALSDLEFLNGDYAVFGYVTSGMETVDEIQQGNTIDSAKVTAGLDNLKRSK
ncbi:MAG: peptidylprolyl isomerase [Microcystaceae cyanobacterium]